MIGLDDLNATQPQVSFGLPVRNGEKFLSRLLDSLAQQTLSDYEIIICDNGSSDKTVQLCQAAMERDARIRFIDNGENIGQIENFNKVLKLARGQYFRWIGVDDWLEPNYAECCVNELQQNPQSIGVTTYQCHHEDDGNMEYAEYTGPRLDAPLRHQRFARMMWFLHADFRFIDPIYTMLRRDILMRTQLLQIVPKTDQLLAAELSLHGPIVHVPLCLAHRRREMEDAAVKIQRYHQTRAHELMENTWRECSNYRMLLTSVSLTKWQRLHCEFSIIRYAATGLGRSGKHKLRNGLRRVPGYGLLRMLKRAVKNKTVDDAVTD